MREHAGGTCHRASWRGVNLAARQETPTPAGARLVAPDLSRSHQNHRTCLTYTMSGVHTKMWLEQWGTRYKYIQHTHSTCPALDSSTPYRPPAPAAVRQMFFNVLQCDYMVTIEHLDDSVSKHQCRHLFGRMLRPASSLNSAPWLTQHCKHICHAINIAL